MILVRSVGVTTTLLLSTLCPAQQTVPATGHDAAGSGGSMSYTVGQVDFTTQSSSGGTVAQGVQQPYEFLVLSNNEPSGADFSTTLLPNPTSEGVTLQLKGALTTTLHYELFDGTGKLVRTGRITSTTTPIPMEGLGAATYLLHVVRDGVPVSITRIIKH